MAIITSENDLIMKITSKYILVILFLFGSNLVFASEQRTALVIGNSKYQSSPLINPANDARDIADALRLMKFEVIERIDVNRERLRYAIREFADKLKKKGGIGFFYFAGHGIQVDGANYLLPTDIKASSEEDITDDGIDANSVLRAMEDAKNEVNIVVLDACRNNPFARSFRSTTRGLKRMEGPSGSFIAYATAPGSTAADGSGSNGIYTKYLLQSMMEPGVPIENVFKKVRIAVEQATKGQQTPWESSSLKGDFYFIDKVVIQSSPQAMAEAALWNQLKDSNVVEDFESFIAANPKSMYKSAAKLRIKQLKRRTQLVYAKPTTEVKTDPVDPIYNEGYGLLNKTDNDPKKVAKILALYREAQSIAPNTTKLFTFRSAILVGMVQIANAIPVGQMSDIKEIIQLYDEANKLAPHTAEAKTLRALAVESYIKLVNLSILSNQFNDAIATASKGLEFEQSNDKLKALIATSYLAIAQNLQKEGDIIQAINNVDRGLKIDVGNPRLMSYRAELNEVKESNDRTMRFVPPL